MQIHSGEHRPALQRLEIDIGSHDQENGADANGDGERHCLPTKETHYMNKYGQYMPHEIEEAYDDDDSDIERWQHSSDEEDEEDEDENQPGHEPEHAEENEDEDDHGGEDKDETQEGDVQDDVDGGEENDGCEDEANEEGEEEEQQDGELDDDRGGGGADEMEYPDDEVEAYGEDDVLGETGREEQQHTPPWDLQDEDDDPDQEYEENEYDHDEADAGEVEYQGEDEDGEQPQHDHWHHARDEQDAIKGEKDDDSYSIAFDVDYEE